MFFISDHASPLLLTEQYNYYTVTGRAYKVGYLTALVEITLDVQEFQLLRGISRAR